MRPSVRLLACCLLVGLVPAAAHAQSSQFGVRSLGFPGYGTSVPARGTGGSFGLFDDLSTINPASIGGLPVLTASFIILGDNRSQANGAGSGTARSSRFPGFFIGGPIPHLPLTIALSASTYLNRDYGLATSDTLTLRGTPQQAFDTLTSKGGITDVRLALAYRLGRKTAFGFGAHVLTGSTREELRRGFADSTYTETAQLTELSGTGAGFSIGFIHALLPNLAIAGSARYDTRLRVKRDSIPKYDVDLPMTLDGSIKFRPVRRLDLGFRAEYRNWSRADAQLVAQGAPGAANTFLVAGGLEFLTDFRRPYNKPIRFGVRYQTLPFYLVRGAQGHEYAASVGTGTRFAGGRGGIDLALDRAVRADGTGRTETAYIITAGISIRP
jgi:hypothetical protein